MPLYRRLANVFRLRRVDRELEDELAFHIAERTDDLVAAGMTPEQARLQAARAFGNYAVQKERTRDMDVAGWLESWGRDLRHGARQLRLNPGFTAVAVLSLALGIGANAAIFQLINALRLRSLPVHEPWQLVTVESAPEFFVSGWYSARHRASTAAQFEEIRKQQQAFSGLFAFGTERFNLSQSGEARYADGLYVTGNFLDVLGVTPNIGHGRVVADGDTACSSAGVLLNHSFWMREFGGDPAVVGREMYVHGRMFPIAGVTPPEFFGIEPGRRFDVALPTCADALLAKDGKGRLALRHAWWLTPVGRLKPGWTVERASAHLRDVSPAVFRETVPSGYRPDAVEKYLKNRFRVISASAGLSSLRKEYENPLWILLAVTGLVMLIACENLANLLLARASAREREIGVRQALGASRGRLIAQLLSESLLLAALGALLGAALAQAISRGLVAFLSTGQEELQLPLAVDWHALHLHPHWRC